MHSSAATSKLAPALTKAMAALKNPIASQKVSTGKFSYTYAPLNEILDHVRKTLERFDLAAPQEAMTDNQGRVGVTTRIIHGSGEWLEFGPLYLPAGQGTQDHGSALTYARRYALTSALGLAAEEDDDASKVTKTPRGGGVRAPAVPPRGATVEEVVGNSAGSGDANPLGDPERPPPTNGETQTPTMPPRGREKSEGSGSPDPTDGHKFKGDPDGACLICSWFLDAHSAKAGVTP